MFGNHGLGCLLEEGAHGKSPKCFGGNLGEFGEFCKGIDLSLKGVEPSMRPSWWLPDSQQEREKIRKAMKPLSVLAKARGMSEESIFKQASLENDGKELYFLPFTSARSKEWVVILNEQADFLGYASIDGFIK